MQRPSGERLVRARHPSKNLRTPFTACIKFPIDAEINYHKFSVLTQIYALIVLEVRGSKQVPLGQCQGVSRAAFLLEVLEEKW